MRDSKLAPEEGRCAAAAESLPGQFNGPRCIRRGYHAVAVAGKYKLLLCGQHRRVATQRGLCLYVDDRGWAPYFDKEVVRSDG